LIKKDDPGVPSIEYTINGYSFQKTLYDTGSDVNIMATDTYQLLHRTMPLQPTYIQLQMIFRLLIWEKTIRSAHHPWETVALNQVWREKIVIHEEEAPPEPPTTPSSESQND